MLTQVEVDPNDEAFQNPTKPIGAFMTKEEADKMVAERGYNVIEDSRPRIPPGGRLSQTSVDH